jgi:hypothetical protein
MRGINQERTQSFLRNEVLENVVDQKIVYCQGARLDRGNIIVGNGAFCKDAHESR